jgi:hypothetical protein
MARLRQEVFLKRSDPAENAVKTLLCGQRSVERLNFREFSPIRNGTVRGRERVDI